MRPKIKRTTRKASRLYDADAGWVSLVPGGANETPFLVVKRNDGDDTMKIKSRNKKSHKKVDAGNNKTEVQKVDVVLAKMVFDGNLFEDKSSVEHYIKQAEWDADGVAIEKDDNGDWVAREGGYEDSDYIELSKVETEDEGVVAFVGTRKSAAVKSDEDDASDDATVAADEESPEDNPDSVQSSEHSSDNDKPKKKPMKSEKSENNQGGRRAFLQKRAEEKEAVQKFSGWDAAISKATVIGKALAAGMEYDTTPPGYQDVVYTYSTVVASILGDEKLDESERDDLVRKASSDLASITLALDALFTEYTDADDETITKSIEGEDNRKALAKWAEGYADFLVTKAVDQKPVAGTCKKSDKPDTQPTSNVSELVAKAVSEAIDPIRETMQSTATLVEKIASRKPAKKAHDVDSATGSGKVQKTDNGSDIDDFGAAFL